MIFYSMVFAVFLAVVLIAVKHAKTCRRQHIVLLLANMVFYGYWDVRFLGLIALAAAVAYFSAIAYEKQKCDLFIHLAAACFLGLLGVFKYLNFFLESFCRAFAITSMSTIRMILPLGISFYLFQAMSYILDVRQGKLKAEKDFVKLAVYVSFFPVITSGPIVKAHDFLPQLNYLHKIKKENVYAGLQLFLLGLTKKIVFADRIGLAVDAVYSAPEAFSGISIFWAVIGYSMQIYCDFSGYSDMAIGIARILDFDLGTNFNLPYIAKNPSDFWRRWHISLSSWFRDYVYIPLGGSRGNRFATCRNLFITMLLSGIWHGANWTFVLWGAIHGIGSVVHKLFRDACRKNGKQFGAAFAGISVICNYIFVTVLWVVFRSSDLNQTIAVLGGLFRSTGIHYVNVYVVLYTVILLFSQIFCALRNNGQAILPKLNLDTFKGQFLFALWILLIISFMYIGNSAFIYAQF